MTALTMPTALRGHSTLALASLLVFAGAALSIATALAFEHLGGYEPCPLCMQQRLAYHLAIPIALLAFLLARSNHEGLAALLLGLVALAFLGNVGLGIYHAGVEWKWWAGPASCAATGELTIAEGTNLLESLRVAGPVPCGEAPWRFLGLSFAGWSAVISLGLAGVAAIGVLNWREAIAR